MSKTVTIRIKQYGDNGKMEDVGEIVVPEDSPPISRIEFSESREKFYRLGAVSIEFGEANSEQD